MTRQALYAILLCLVAVTAADNVPTVFVKEGENQYFTLGEKELDQFEVISCILTLNNGTEVTVYSPSVTSDFKSKYKLSSLFDKCQIQVYGASQKDAGKWKIKSTITKLSNKITTTIQKEYSFDVQVRKEIKEKKAGPATTIMTYPDQEVTFHFNEKFDNLASCKLLNPKNVIYNLESATAEHIRLSGKCGLKMIVKKEYAGRWTLVADLNNSTTFLADFNIIVKDNEKLTLKKVEFNFKRGNHEVIHGDYNNDETIRNAKMCILEDPRGVRLPVESGYCRYEINSVSQIHEGVWKAYYGFAGMEQLVEQEIHVRTYDISSFSGNVTHNPTNGAINLLCQVRNQALQFCSFIRPDGEILHMTVGVGNKDYEYYGNGVLSVEYDYLQGVTSIYDCGVTIKNPKNVDYGAWKCLMSVSGSEKIGRILKVESPSKSNGEKSEVTVNDVFARKDDPFTIKCTADEMLSYCWLSSPNGTVYSINGNEPVSLPNRELAYTGLGLELGDCTVKIDKATESDEGRWTCHVGVVNGPELEGSFNLHVQETSLMAARDIVVIKKNVVDTELYCQPLPGSDKVIESCRWVTPAGHGVNAAYGRYVTQSGSRHCRLAIKTINLDEDLGEWSCFARFSPEDKKISEEGSATIKVVYESSTNVGTMSVALVVSLLFCTVFGIGVLILYKRRMAAITAARLDEKIILEKPSQKYP